MDGLARGGTYHGPDEVREGVFLRIGSEWDRFRLTVDDGLDAGDTVVAVGTYAGTCKATGRELEARVVHVFHVTDGAIAAFQVRGRTRAVP